jgi:hypothetical protein
VRRASLCRALRAARCVPGQEIALVKALGGGYRAGLPVELKLR